MVLGSQLLGSVSRACWLLFTRISLCQLVVYAILPDWQHYLMYNKQGQCARPFMLQEVFVILVRGFLLFKENYQLEGEMR